MMSNIPNKQPTPLGDKAVQYIGPYTLGLRWAAPSGRQFHVGSGNSTVEGLSDDDFTWFLNRKEHGVLLFQAVQKKPKAKPKARSTDKAKQVDKSPASSEEKPKAESSTPGATTGTKTSAITGKSTSSIGSSPQKKDR